MDFQRLGTLSELKNVMNINKIVIVYGAGKVSMVLVSYLHKHHISDSVLGLAVSDKYNNPKEILGIPVYTIDELNEYVPNATVVIATVEKSQIEISKELSDRNCKSVYGISNLLYARMQRENASYEVEILQNTMYLKKQQLSLLGLLKQTEQSIRLITTILVQDEKYHDQFRNPANYIDGLRACYEQRTGESLDFGNLVTYNQKMQWLKLYDASPLKTKLADKYAVREYVSQKIGGDYLIPLFGVWEKFEEIDISQLPDKFVLKCTHGSGWNVLIKDKRTMNLLDMKQKFDSWLHSNYAFISYEMQYFDIKPQIVAEEFLETTDGSDLKDYKLFVFHGKVKIIQVDLDRFSGHHRNLYTPEWVFIDGMIDLPNAPEIEVARPECLDKLIELAERLGRDFIHVRVDFYIHNNRIYFGEMTFTHGSGLEKFVPAELGVQMGEWIVLPDEIGRL